MSRWKPFRYHLEEIACRSLARLIPKLSRRAVLSLGNSLGSLAFRLDARGRSVALSNLECAFGSQFDLEKRKEIARQSYQNFAQTMLGLFWARRLTSENFKEWMVIEGFERLRARLDQEKRGAIFMCVHQGNWEWASLACGFLGFGNVVVAENFKNPRLTEIFREVRQHSGQTLIGQDNSLLRLLKTAKRGGATGMLIDLNLRPDQSATLIEAFGPGGLRMCVPLLHAVLAQRANALLVPVETEPLPDGRCRIIAHPALELSQDLDLAQIAQRCWDFFEPVIRARPGNYLWPYKHFRYRPKGSTRGYPSYANESGKFERLAKTLKKSIPH